MNDTQCRGCGAELQSDRQDAPGFVPPGAERGAGTLCRRCFRIRNYNDAADVTIDSDDFLQLLHKIGSTDSLVLSIVDLLDFEGSLIQGLHRFVGANSIVLAVNKIDLLPKVTNWNRIVNWVQRRMKEHGLKVQDIVCLSARRNLGFDRLLQAVDENRNGKDVYVVGATNVGKSSVINRLIRDYSDMDQELTVSPYPGTTLHMVRIPLDDGQAIIDMPGIVYPHRLSELTPKRALKALLPEKPLKPAVYQLEERQTLFFGSFARFDFTAGVPQSFTCYISNEIPIHRTKLDNAEALFEKHKGVMLAPPRIEDLEAMPAWERHDLNVPRGQQCDVSISGLGWVKVNSDAGAKITVYAPRGVKVTVRESMI